METITIPRIQFEQMQKELQTLRQGTLYARLLDFERNVCQGKKFSRKDLGF
jgi:hypothetical protein